MEEIESLLAATTTLYVGNLSFYTSEEQIHALFTRAGRIKRIIMGLNKKSLEPCGFCFVKYYTRASTEIAMRYINRTILDEKIKLISSIIYFITIILANNRNSAFANLLQDMCETTIPQVYGTLLTDSAWILNMRFRSFICPDYLPHNLICKCSRNITITHLLNCKHFITFGCCKRPITLYV
ncbi:hypothetical protein P9112_012396 [Eukaryota sp. TZLM1-RC]